jgi:hypothetical protein
MLLLSYVFYLFANGRRLLQCLMWVKRAGGLTNLTIDNLDINRLQNIVTYISPHYLHIVLIQRIQDIPKILIYTQLRNPGRSL